MLPVLPCSEKQNIELEERLALEAGAERKARVCREVCQYYSTAVLPVVWPSAVLAGHPPSSSFWQISFHRKRVRLHGDV